MGFKFRHKSKQALSPPRTTPATEPPLHACAQTWEGRRPGPAVRRGVGSPALPRPRPGLSLPQRGSLLPSPQTWGLFFPSFCLLCGLFPSFPCIPTLPVPPTLSSRRALCVRGRRARALPARAGVTSGQAEGRCGQSPLGVEGTGPPALCRLLPSAPSGLPGSRPPCPPLLCVSGEEEKSRPPREAFRAPRSSKSLPDLIGAFAFGGKFSSRNCLLQGPFSVPMRYCKGKDPDLEPQGPAWWQGRPGPRGSTRGRDSALGSGAASFSATSSQVGHRPGDRTGGRGVRFGDPVWEGAVRPGWLCVILQPSRTCTPSPSLLGKGEPRHRWAGAVVSTRGAPKNPPLSSSSKRHVDLDAQVLA